MASITLKGVHKTYPGNVTAVSNFNLEITDKEFVVLVGPSGCGKSTTLRMIAGLEEISAGEIYIGEQLVNQVPPKDRNIAMVFQNYALYPHMTVFQNMAYGLKLRKTPKKEIEDRVHAAAVILEIDALLDRKPKALSGGERQRVALGRAMVRNPAVFLFDEPLSNLDAKLRATMRTEIKKLHEKLEATFVFVTHDQTEAMTMGDRIVVMKDGLIQQTDTPRRLYDSPCNVFTAGFVGSPQMNFLNGTFGKDGDRYYVDFGCERLFIRSDGAVEKMDKYLGKVVKTGIRPEDIYIDYNFLTSNPDSTLNAVVDFTELLGSEVYLHLNHQGDRLIARLPPDTDLKEGTIIKIGIDIRKTHLFNIDTEEAIL